MILDDRNEFCDAVSLNTGAAGTYLLGDQIDLGAAAANVGAVDEVYLVITVDTGIRVASSTGTIQFKLASDDTASISTSTATDHFITPAFATSATSDAGALKAGTVLAAVKLPQGFTYERYLGILQVTGTTAISAGKINAFLTEDVALWRAYDSPSQA
jgi:hypothetical protein